MSELDEKIRQALEGTDTFVLNENSVYLDRIKQAFADEGYIPIEPGIRKYLEAGGDEKFYVISQEYVDKHCMTGQEWYDRYVNSLRPLSMWQVIDQKECLEAAKRAAGLTNDTPQPQGSDKVMGDPTMFEDKE